MVRPGYKQTEVGEIPEDWDVKHIASIASITTGDKNTQDRIDDGLYPFFVRSQSVERINSYSFDGEAVLTAGDGVGTGKIFHYINGKFDYHQRVYNIHNFKSEVDGFYFYKYFSSRFYVRIMSMTAKSSVDSVRREMIADMQIALPNEAEQKAIAKALSDVDELIASQEKLIAKKRDIKTATMQQLLTGKKRLSGFGKGKGYKQTELGVIPEDWDVKPIGDLLRIRHGKSQKEVFDPNGDYPILATGGEIGRAREPLYSKPSVLIGRKGTIDIPYYMDTPFWTVDTLFYSEVSNNADAKFMFYKFLFVDWYQYNEASGVPSLNAATIEKIIQAVPSTKEEQSAISGLLTGFDTEIKVLESRLNKTKAVKQGMMQELLTGRTRLLVEKEDVAA